MRVLFVSRDKGNCNISPVIKSQGLSLVDQCVDLEFFTIKGKGFSGYLRNLFILKNILKKKSYDIIHAHYGFSGILCLLSRGKEPIVVSLMGSDMLCSEKPDGSKSIKSLLITSINKWTSRLFYDATIVKSSEMVRKCGRTNNLFLIANGVDLGKFIQLSKVECRKRLGWTDDQSHVLFAADPSRIEKNFSLAEEAVQLLPDPGKINLHITKDVPHNDIPIYMNASDLVLLSSFREGSPNVIKEAMACNSPVVSTNVGDVNEVVGNTEGCYISSFDPADVAEKIRLALEFAHSKSRTNGRKRIIELGLDSETVAAKIIEVYNKVLKIID